MPPGSPLSVKTRMFCCWCCEQRNVRACVSAHPLPTLLAQVHKFPSYIKYISNIKFPSLPLLHTAAQAVVAWSLSRSPAATQGAKLCLVAEEDSASLR